MTIKLLKPKRTLLIKKFFLIKMFKFLLFLIIIFVHLFFVTFLDKPNTRTFYFVNIAFVFINS